MRFWQAGLAAFGGVMTVSASAAETSSFVYVAPPKPAATSSFLAVTQIPPPQPPAPVKLARSPVDAPPDYRWDASPRIVSASIVAFGTPEPETPARAPAPHRAERRIAHIAPATVIRTGVVGGAFPGATAIASAAAPAAPKPGKRRETPVPRKERPAPEPLAPPPPAPPQGSNLPPLPGLSGNSRPMKPM